MSINTVRTLEIYRFYFEFTFYDAKAFFNFLAFLINADNSGGIICQIGADSIENIIRFFFGNSIRLNPIFILQLK